MRKGKLSLEVIFRILNELYVHGKLKKTHLYMLSRLNYSNFQRYLNYLIEKNLVKIVKNSDCEYVELTSKGFEVVEKIINEIRKTLSWEF